MKHPLLASLFVAGSSLVLSSGALADRNGTLAPDATTVATHGNVWYTAAINSDGTVAGCNVCDKANTSHLATGEYQVGFYGTITAATGFSRWAAAS